MEIGAVPRRAYAHPAHASTDAELFRRWQEHRDKRAREELVFRHLPLARKLAGRYRRTQEPFEDLLQVASVGLIKAIDRFDPERGLAFASFAVPTILGEIKRHFRDKGWAVHLPRGLQELMLRIQDADHKLGAIRQPTVVQIAQYLNIDEEQVLEGLEALAAHRADSMDQPLEVADSGSAATPHDTVGTLDEGYALVDTSASLASAVKQLRLVDREVLALRFRDELTQAQIAERIGVSQMQVSRILRRATDQLREHMEGEPPALPAVA
jgi:RNA polymerase sigma-B factor